MIYMNKPCNKQLILTPYIIQSVLIFFLVSMDQIKNRVETLSILPIYYEHPTPVVRKSDQNCGDERVRITTVPGCVA